MTDPLDRVLQLVADGRLTADEAAPILEALDRKAAPGAASPESAPGAASGSGTEPGPGDAERRPARYARIEVREHGRRVVDLRIPISLGRFALTRVPGLSKEQIAEVEEAVTSGAHGPILDVQDPDGDGVRIVLE
jgi:SHOCT-like domain